MGTNYYLKIYSGDKCSKCGRSDELEILHIGKSSAGWMFVLNPHNDKYPDFRSWRDLLEKHPNSIFDEYGERISLYNFYKLIESKKDGNYGHTEQIDEFIVRISDYSDFS